MAEAATHCGWMAVHEQVGGKAWGGLGQACLPLGSGRGLEDLGESRPGAFLMQK